jgi:DNA-binding response OmpR family regulator
VAEVLVVEDEARLRAVLGRLLETDGYHVCGVETGSEALRLAMSREFDLVVLDLNLPDLSGADVLRVLHAAQPALRVLVLSSVTEVGARVQVLENGAADFVLKPFVAAELLARVRLRIRHEIGSPGPATPGVSRLPVAADVVLDLDRRELCVGGERVPLSQREFSLLHHLLNRRGEICSRQELLADVWGIGFDPGTNVVDVYVRRLRNKLAGDAIETVRNVGYRLAAS